MSYLNLKMKEIVPYLKYGFLFAHGIVGAWNDKT
jgi:hypothetical protein